MKNTSWKIPLLFLFLTLFLFQSKEGNAAGWGAVITPGTLNPDSTIRILHNEVQVLPLVLQADATITGDPDVNATQTGTLEWNMPQGLQILSSGGYYNASLVSQQTSGNREILTYSFSVTESSLDGVPGARITTEWKNHVFYVKATTVPASGNDFITLTLRQGANSDTWTWPLAVTPLRTPAGVPSKITLGFWDYGWYRAGTASTEVANLWSKLGISYTQYGGVPSYVTALRNKGIITGGNVHNSHF
ncbi:MAG: hypothetical protein IPL87_01830 [Candidatus Moraniibacteriota bacterium]|nr:MAG: hypothetical protein IPL87_01830 [Candidatus Moranbacteria bacterium]